MANALLTLLQARLEQAGRGPRECSTTLEQAAAGGKGAHLCAYPEARTGAVHGPLRADVAPSATKAQQGALVCT